VIAQLQVVILGAVLGGVYALMASGLTLVFGVMRIVNIAHAAFIGLAAYLSFWAFTLYHVDPMVSIAIDMPILFGLGAAVYRLLFAPIADRRRHSEMTVLLSFALALVIEGVTGFLFSGVYRTTTPDYASDSFELELGPLVVSPGDDELGPLVVPKGQLYATVLSLALLGGLLAFLRLTRTGRAIRATMQNRAAAQLVGVNVRWISTLTFGIGTALAGASGALQSFLFPFFPAKHWQWIASLLALIVLGGMGSLLGTFVGAMLLSIASAVLSDRYGPTWSQATFFLALFVILLVRPHGLFGKKAEL
jgi:branched-chain amino acid transport system permease protein